MKNNQEHARCNGNSAKGKAKPKILFVSHHPTIFSGGERVLLRFLTEPLSFHVSVFAPAGEFLATLSALGHQPVRAKFLRRFARRRNLLWLLASALKFFFAEVEIIYRLATQRPQIVQCNTFYPVPYFVGPCKLFRIPLVWHEHSFTTAYHPTAAKICGQAVSHIISVSDAVRQELLRLGVRDDKVTTIYNSIALPAPENLQKQPPISSIAEMRRAGFFCLGAAGPIEPRKGFLEVIEAVSLLEHCALFIAGTVTQADHAEYERRLHQYVAEHDLARRVIFLGRVNTMERFFNQIDLFVHYPTEPDPLPTVIIEALANRCPVVASSNGGNPECLGNGQWGTLVSPCASPALALKVAELQEHPPGRLSVATQAAVLEYFSGSRKAALHMEVYNKLLGHNSTPDCNEPV